jgi:hypothetical protein
MASTDARPVPRKNVAYRVTFPLFDADGDLVTGAASLDSEISKDGGTFADCTNEATEIATASGMYFLDLTSTEMNADTVAIIVKTGTAGAKTTPIVMYPEEVGDMRCDVVQLGGSTQSATDLQDFADAGYDPATNQVEGVKLTDTVTTYTGNTKQTGDNYVRLGAPVGASISADIAAVPVASLDVANGIETGLTPRQATRLIAAATAGKVSGAETTTAVIRNAVQDSKARISATVDASGNRTAITWDVT